MEIQPIEYADLRLVAELDIPGWNIIPHFDFYINSNFCFPIKVSFDNKIVGIGTSIIHGDIAWLAHIIVHPDERNKGVGRAVTEALVTNLKATNCETIYLIATDLGFPVYQKIGFETETEYLVLKDIKMDHTSEISLNIAHFNEKHREQIIKLDSQISGENRLIQLKNHLKDASVYCINSIVEGYYLPSWGEGLIIANNPAAGIELMKLRNKKNAVANLPIDNETGIQFLLNNGFNEIKQVKRMRLGKKRMWEPANIYNRIAGSVG